MGQANPPGPTPLSASSAGRARTSGCLLVELARQMGTLATYLDIEPGVSTHELLTDASRLTAHGVRQALTSVAPGLDVLVGPYLDITPGSFSPRHVYQLVELCRRLAATVVLDVPCAFDDLQFETLALADQVVLVGVQSVSSIRTLKMVRDTLEREEGIRGQRLVINRYEPGLPGFSAERLAELLQVPQVLTITNDYPSVMAAVNHGKPLRLVAPQSRVLADIRSLASALSGSGPSLAPVEGTDRLARAMGKAATGPPPPRRLARAAHRGRRRAAGGGGPAPGRHQGTDLHHHVRAQRERGGASVSRATVRRGAARLSPGAGQRFGLFAATAGAGPDRAHRRHIGRGPAAGGGRAARRRRG